MSDYVYEALRELRKEWNVRETIRKDGRQQTTCGCDMYPFPHRQTRECWDILHDTAEEMARERAYYDAVGPEAYYGAPARYAG